MRISLMQQCVGATYHVARDHKSQRQWVTRLAAPTRNTLLHDLLALTVAQRFIEMTRLKRMPGPRARAEVFGSQLFILG